MSRTQAIGSLAALAVAAVLALGASKDAHAASWLLGQTYGGFSTNSLASLNVECKTIHHANGTKTWSVEARTGFVRLDGFTVALKFQYSTSSGSSGFYNWSYVGNGALVYRSANVVAESTPSRTVRFVDQFAVWAWGRWNYSPNGSYEYASHTTTRVLTQGYVFSHQTYEYPCTLW